MRSFINRLCVLAVFVSLLLAGCGGGGGGSTEPAPKPPPTIVLSGGALDAESIALSWEVDDLYSNQAYAITVDGSPYTYTTQKGYYFSAQPARRYCFTVMVGSLMPPLGAFAAAGPTSNEVCITTPSLPPLEPGWNKVDAGLGYGKFPAIARRNASSPGLVACNSEFLLYDLVLLRDPSYSFFRVFGGGIVLPMFTVAGGSCAVADERQSWGEVHALTLSSAILSYRQASVFNLSWGFTNDWTIASDADWYSPASIALDANGSPQVLYGSNGKAYWSQLNTQGQWTAPELVGNGTVSWRSLAVAADGVVFALLSEGAEVRVLKRSAPAAWLTVFSASDAQGLQLQSLRGIGSIVASASGGVRVAYSRAASTTALPGVGYVEWLGGAAPWTETLVDAGTYVAAPAVAVDLNGEPLIAYGGSGSDLRLARRIGGSWQTVFIDALGVLARQTDIEVDSDGLIHILYSDENGPAKLATGR